MARKYKRGDTFRTQYADARRDQVFRLKRPVPNLGNERGGHWWVSRMGARTDYESILLVNHCPRVSPSELKRLRLT